MITIYLRGGLGNQLFQYAYGKTQALKRNTSLCLNTYYLENGSPKDTPRQFALGAFALSHDAQTNTREPKWIYYIKKILRRECFFQNEKFFLSTKNLLQKEIVDSFSLSEYDLDILKKITATNSVSVHIRRGDYVTNNNATQHHGICAPNYYYKAFEIIKDVAQKELTFFVFSDDVEWVKNNIHFPGTHYIVSNTATSPAEELVLMSKCKYNVIANSTFSWWGAWLNSNKDKVVIAPKEWLSKKPESYKDIIPSSWKTI